MSSGYLIVTDPDQEVKGYFRLLKIPANSNKAATIAALNTSRAQRDIKEVCFWACTDMKKADGFIKEALKSRFVSGSSEWFKVKIDSEGVAKGIAKQVATIDTLIKIINGDDNDN